MMHRACCSRCAGCVGGAGPFPARRPISAGEALVFDPPGIWLTPTCQEITHLVHCRDQPPLQLRRERDLLLPATCEYHHSVWRPNSVGFLNEQALRGDLHYVRLLQTCARSACAPPGSRSAPIATADLVYRPGRSDKTATLEHQRTAKPMETWIPSTNSRAIAANSSRRPTRSPRWRRSVRRPMY